MCALPYGTQKAIFSVIEAIPPLAALANRWAINRVVNRARHRPHPLSTKHDYVSWAGLTDRHWSARHLPSSVRPSPPAPEALAELFERKDGQQRLCPKSTCLFPSFAQYLTDGFIRTESPGLTQKDDDPRHRLRRNTSNHEIDLCPLYGRTEEQTDALRLKSSEPGRKGRLKSEMHGHEEFAPLLYSKGRIDRQFAVLDKPLGAENLTREKRAKLFAFGGDRANSVPQTAMMNTLFLREHNRIAGLIEADNPKWDDDRVFETARNTVIVLFIKIVVEDYINHISPLPFTLRADPKVVWKAPWNKPNWITTEFSLLYRWHALIPDVMRWNGQDYPLGETFMHNEPLIEGGLLQAFKDVSATQAGELGPRNTNPNLLPIEIASIRQDRDCELASFSDYCNYLGQDRPRSFSDISSDPEVEAMLKKHYAKPRDVDFHVGLFCEDRVANSPLPNLVLLFVALDAFSQALPNPLLSEHVFKKSTFSAPGWATIHETKTLRDIVDRNVHGGAGDAFVGMTREDWQPE